MGGFKREAVVSPGVSRQKPSNRSLYPTITTSNRLSHDPEAMPNRNPPSPPSKHPPRRPRLRSSPHSVPVTSPLDMGGGVPPCPCLSHIPPSLSFLRSFQRGPGDQSWSSSQNGQEQGGGMYLVNHSFEKRHPPPPGSSFSIQVLSRHISPPLSAIPVLLRPCLPPLKAFSCLFFFLIICRENKLALLLGR